MTYTRTKTMKNGEVVTLAMNLKVDEEQPIPSMEYERLKYWVDKLLHDDNYLPHINMGEETEL